MGIISITGIADSRVASVCADIFRKKAGQCLVAAPTFIRAKRLASDLSFFTDEKIYLLPSDEEVFVNYEAKNKDVLLERLKILRALASGERCMVVAPVDQIVQKLPPKKYFMESVLRLAEGDRAEVHDICSKLTDMGYERVPMVYAKGQFSARGGIVDIFSPYDEKPCRAEFFDIELESLRYFDPETQRSAKHLKSAEFYPAQQIVGPPEIFSNALKKISRNYASLEERRDQLAEAVKTRTNMQYLEHYTDYFYSEPEFLWDYMAEGTVMIDDPSAAMEKIESRTKEFKRDFEIFLEKKLVSPADMKYFPGKKEYLELYRQEHVYFCMPFAKTVRGAEEYEAVHNIQSRQGMMFNGRLELLEKELNIDVEEGYKVTIACSSDERLDNMGEFLEICGLKERVWLRKGQLSAGMVFPEEKIYIISDTDIFGKPKYRRRHFGKDGGGQAIKNFSDISKGDYVVHYSHGIGRFLGIEQMDIQGYRKDYFKVEYAGHDILYVPVEQMDLVQKYVGSDSAAPRINKMGGPEWRHTKAKAKAAVASMAKELLEISAARKKEGGYQFGPDTVWQKDFEGSFPYEETPDQIRCIEEIKADMERPEAMDRLLCGDVGYGKTEVAARALFKCAAEGKQAVMLVPTTVLASQHWHTLTERFSGFPFSVEMLSRFRSDAQQKKVIKGLKSGSVDIVIGTHKLLSSAVSFKDLGLLIIDEEQRFGVQHKESIKKLRKNVDVLTLSATPIPRTLHMSLLGLRDMSIIKEPPEGRYPVQTYVTEQEDFIIREAVQRELDRGGQVYVIFNRVSGIYKVADGISRLVPGCRISVGHGRMAEDRLEDVMMDFMAGNADVLIATTIIENGIDIPNVNTVIIIDADRYGLSQLYQLRGRVGRSNRLAYAYLMHKKDKVLSEVAEKRLRAIKDFTEFGAGFKIAMRDLEIRGAGDILGTEQHGHIVNVGYEMYCQMVEDAVKALKDGRGTAEREETTVNIHAAAYIPETYIEDEMLKLEMYKKIAAVSDEASAEEMRSELADRFGHIPEETENLIKIARIKALAQGLGIRKVTQKGSKTPDEMIEMLTMVQKAENVV